MGRWIKYKSAAQFADAVDAYFRRITYVAEAREPDTWENGKPKKGKIIKGLDGKPIKVLKYAVPPSIVALQNELKISHTTWSNYAKKPGYSEVIEYARRTVEEYLLSSIITLGKDARGAEFRLRCMGYNDKAQDKPTAAAQPNPAENLPTEEKAAILQTLISAEMQKQTAEAPPEDRQSPEDSTGPAADPTPAEDENPKAETSAGGGTL